MPEDRKRILVVDDDEGIRTSLARILRASEHEVMIASDGFHAVQLVRDGLTPDLLLIDLCMPGMDGIETFQRLREYCPGLISIFMTAYSTSEKTVEANQRGALSVVPKPLDISNLLKLVTSGLGESPVLIAEDDPHLLKSIGRALSASGIEVETVTSLRDAAQLLRQRPNRVVIADVFLEDGHGYDLLAYSCEQSGTNPLILITGHADWIDGATAKSLHGKVLCLPKPLNIEQLIEQVNRP
ncbi:MAG: response regulator [Rubripirellula sp.]